MEPAIIDIEPGVSYTSRLLCCRAKACGLRPIVISPCSDALNRLCQQGVQHVHTDLDCEEELLRVCTQLKASQKIAAITSTAARVLPAVARLASRLGLPGPDPIATSICCDIYQQLEAFSRYSIPTPEYAIAPDVSEIQSIADVLGYPVAIEPTNGVVYPGIHICHTLHELKFRAEQLLSGQAGRDAQDFLVQRVVPGLLFSVVSFLVDGESAFFIARDRIATDGASTVQIGYDYPSGLNFHLKEQVAKTVSRALKALDLDWGLAHTKVCLTERGPVVVKVVPGLADGAMLEMIRHAQGIDLVQASIRLSTGHYPQLTVTHREHASLRFFGLPQQTCDQSTSSSKPCALCPKLAESHQAQPENVLLNPTTTDWVICRDNDQVRGCDIADRLFATNTRETPPARSRCVPGNVTGRDRN